MKKYLLLLSSAIFLIHCSAPTAGKVENEEDIAIASSSSEGQKKSIYDAVEENVEYTSRDSVAAYLCKFGDLPSNYVSKTMGQGLYEEKTGKAFASWNFNPWATLGVMIGGDEFFNREGLLPQAFYHEADVDYNAANRGTKRLVYSAPCVIYYTADHYKSFSQIAPENL